MVLWGWFEFGWFCGERHANDNASLRRHSAVPVVAWTCGASEALKHAPESSVAFEESLAGGAPRAEQEWHYFQYAILLTLSDVGCHASPCREIHTWCERGVVCFEAHVCNVAN